MKAAIAFLGPDGSGKSSVIASLLSDPEGALPTITHFHLRPELLARSKRTARAATAPHGSVPRGPVTSLCKLAYLLVIYNLGYLLRIKPLIWNGHLIVFDRYYHDLLVDPLRYRYGGPLWLARWVGRLIPRPALWILLDAPAELLQSRKREVPFEETERQRKAYLNLIKELDSAMVVDASQPLEAVVAEIRSAILAFLTREGWTRP